MAGSTSRKVYVAGVGMIPFAKPGASEPYDVMGADAARAALADAGVDYSDVQQAYVGYVYGDSTSGQRALYEVGMTGIPIVNVNNNCSTGSTALYLARQAVESGAVDCASTASPSPSRTAFAPEVPRSRPRNTEPTVASRTGGEDRVDCAGRRGGAMRRTTTTASPILTALALLVLAAPARAVPPEEESAAAPALLDQPPYTYPAEAAEVAPYPERPWHHPAAAVDLLLVRPMMVAGLASGAVLFVGTLPITAATRTTDDAVHALANQARATFSRPLGDF